MAEKTSVWKTHPSFMLPEEEKLMQYIEFDFLAVLDMPINA